MSARRFQDLTIVASDVQRRNGDGPVEAFTVRVFDSLAGQGEHPERVTVPDLSQSLRYLENRTLDTRLDRQILLGRALGDLLLPPHARSLFHTSLMRLKSRDGLRLRLRLDDALGDFPWELAWIQETRGESLASSFLALDPRISIVRHEVLALPADRQEDDSDPESASDHRRVVVAMAAPPPMRPLTYLPAEQQAIRRALASVPGVEATYLPEYSDPPGKPIPSATLNDLALALRSPADIFHFSGHGVFSAEMGPARGTTIGAGGIVLADPEGEALTVGADQLAERLRGSGVRLVILGACETARRDGRDVWSSVAAALLRVGIPAVVAMQYRIRDDLAATFCATLYQALVEGRDIDEAVALGRGAIRIAQYETRTPDLRDWAVPVLCLRAADGRIFPPVQNDEAIRASARALGQVARKAKRLSIRVKQRFGKVGASGRVEGAALGTMRSGSAKVQQEVVDEVEGKMTGAGANRVDGGTIEVHQDVESVTGDVTGVRIGELGGDDPPGSADPE